MLWEFINDYDINRNHLYSVRQPRWTHARVLMDMFMHNHDISSPLLVSINRVQCHFEVFFITNITTGDDTRIRENYKNGTLGDTSSTWDWYIEQPSSQDFTRWKWAMTLLVDETQVLHCPL